MIRIGNKEGHQEWMVLDWGIRGLGDNLSPLEIFTAPPSWTASASCAGVDDEPDTIEFADKYCWECPVRLRCEEDASKDEKHWTVRGGRTPKYLETKRG